MRRFRRAAGSLALSWLVAGCVLGSSPTPDPLSFPEFVGQLGRFGVDVSSWTSGDPGCDDPTLSPTSVRFEARGLDQATDVPLRIYIFRNREAWERRQADVDTCAQAWADDPATFELVQTSPYILAGQGPWPPQFEDAIHKALTESAGSGG